MDGASQTARLCSGRTNGVLLGEGNDCVSPLSEHHTAWSRFPFPNELRHPATRSEFRFNQPSKPNRQNPLHGRFMLRFLHNDGL